jgi:hypothetical protein
VWLLIERLIAEEQHQIGQCLVQLLDLMIAERLRQRDASDIGAIRTVTGVTLMVS